MVQGKGKKNGYLSGHERKEVFRILIDSYRWRVEIDRQKGCPHGLYGGDKLPENSIWMQLDPIADFQRYVDQAETSKILPDWWYFEERMECLALAVDRNEKKNIFESVNKEEESAPEEWADADIRNALAIIAELVVGFDGGGFQRTNDWYDGFVKDYESASGDKQEAWRYTKLFADSLKAGASSMTRSAVINSILGLQQMY